MVALLLVMQNAERTIWQRFAFASVNRVNRRLSLRNAMVRKLQQLSIMFLKEVQSGRLQSKDHARQWKNVTRAFEQIFGTLLILSWIFP